MLEIKKPLGMEQPEIQKAIEFMGRVDIMNFDDSQEASEREYKKFSGALENREFYYPEFSFPQLNKKDIENLKDEIFNALKGIRDKNNLLALFYERLLKRLEQVELIYGSKHGINGDDAVLEYKKIDLELNTEPNRDLFLRLLTRIQNELSQDMTSEDEKLKKRARALNEVIPTAGKKISYNAPQNLEISEIDNSIELAIAGLIIDDETNYGAAEIKIFFEKVLENLGITGWNTIITHTNKTALSINSSSQEIKIPSTREIKGSVLKKKIAHEIGVHVIRAKNGYSSQVGLLGVGIGKYFDTEEGIAKLYEEHLGESRNIPGDTLILALGLVQGLDGIPRDFKKLYEIYFAYHSWESYKSGKKKGLEILRKNSWKRCVRVFKGIDTRTKGVCSSKDFSYQQGYIDLVDFLGDLSDKEKEKVLEYLMQGKFNMFDDSILSILNNVPKSVQELFTKQQEA